MESLRQILFKGKRKDTGEWVEGYFTRYNPTFFGTTAVIETKENDYEVSLKTVGQFTGLFDKNGKKIFEDDVIEYSANEPAIEVYMTGIVVFDKGEYIGLPCVRKGRDRNTPIIPIRTDSSHVKVIGNIHDDASVLKGE